MSRPQVAMVLAAGRGSRARPLSDVIPKPALPLPDGPVIAWPLRLAASADVQRLVVNLWHLADLMARAAQDAKPEGLDLVFSREDHLLGTAGGLALARDRGLLGDSGPVLIINGDALLHLDLAPLIERHCQEDDLITLAMLPHLDPSAWSRVLLDHDGQVTAILPPGQPEPGEVPFLYPGVMLVSRAALNEVPSEAGEVHDLLWNPARVAGRLGGVVVTGHWREVGTPQAYLDAVMLHLRDQPRVHKTARVAKSATIGVALVGPRARVEGDAVVADSVVTHGAVVRRGARVIRSALIGRVEATAGSSVINEFRVENR